MDKKDVKDTVSALFSGFSKLSREERFGRLIEFGALDPVDIEYLNQGGIKDPTLGEKFIENVIGYFQLPLGVITNLNVDGKDYVVPMAVEETSIVAACCKNAKWIRQNGRIESRMIGDEIIGQVQVAHVTDYGKFAQMIEDHKSRLIEMCNEKAVVNMVKRGGGVGDITVRRVPRKDDGSGGDMAVVHIYLNSCNAMGANIINQVCEFLKPYIEKLTGDKVTMCILSNLVDSKLTEVRATIENVDLEMAHKIEEASLFAEQDPYRAATNNKGVLNGVDPILIATGNDWRAVGAGMHAYCVRGGRYRSLTQWKVEGKNLVGTLRAPIIVGTVGGVTSLHPTAKMCLNMLNVGSAGELSSVIAAVGLVQNLGALKALTDEGIVRGHMKLHINNLALGAGAREEEIPLMRKQLEKMLMTTKRISLSQAIEVLQEVRKLRYENLQSSK